MRPTLLNMKIFECMIFELLRQAPLHFLAKLLSLGFWKRNLARVLKLRLSTLPAVTTWTIAPRFLARISSWVSHGASKFQTTRRMYSFLGVWRTASVTWSRTLPRALGISGSLKTTPTGGLYFGGFGLAAGADTAADDAEAPAGADCAEPPNSTASSGVTRASAIVAGTTRR